MLVQLSEPMNAFTQHFVCTYPIFTLTSRGYIVAYVYVLDMKYIDALIVMCQFVSKFGIQCVVH